MRVITKKPVIINGTTVSNQEYSNANDVPAGTPLVLSPNALAEITKAKTEIKNAEAVGDAKTANKWKARLEKIQSAVQKGKDSGAFDAVKNLLGLNKQAPVAPVGTPAPAGTEAGAGEGKDKTMKYILIGGGVLVVGVVVYLLANRSAGKSETK